MKKFLIGSPNGTLRGMNSNIRKQRTQVENEKKKKVFDKGVLFLLTMTPSVQ